MGAIAMLTQSRQEGAPEAPELKALRAYTQRSFLLTEVRLSDAGTPDPVIEGYAAVFDQPTVIQDWFGGYRESIAPGAFKKTIREADIRALFNHNPDWVLGRNKAGTLTLKEDDHGLAVTIHPPDTAVARDLVESMRRGDINQMSFGFETIKDQWTFAKDEEFDDRRLLEVRLWDVSPVTFPAYPQTEAYVRSAIAALQRYLTPPEPAPRGHSATDRREPPAVNADGHSLDDEGSRPDALPAEEAPQAPEPAPQLSHSLVYYEALLTRIEAGIS